MTPRCTAALIALLAVQIIGQQITMHAMATKATFTFPLMPKNTPTQ